MTASAAEVPRTQSRPHTLLHGQLLLLCTAPPLARSRPQVASVFSTHGDLPSKARLTWSLLYVIFPAVAGGVGLSILRVRHMRRPLPALREAFAGADTLQDLKAVFRFRDTVQVSGVHAARGAAMQP